MRVRVRIAEPRRRANRIRVRGAPTVEWIMLHRATRRTEDIIS